MKVLRYGERALLVELDGPAGPRPASQPAPQPADLSAALAALAGVVEVVPGARTVLVEFDTACDPDAVLAEIRAAAASASPTEPAKAGDVLDVEVDYDGPDLVSVAIEIGLDPAEVVRLHSGAIYTVAFCGFSPGFSYLVGLDPRLQLPRLPEPRIRVPAGSVGVAGEFTGVYPRASPGGWRLLGRTDAALWRVDRDPPALLPPGLKVRFVPR